MSLDNINLTGHFLIAMPNLADPYFAKSVTFICSHSEEGAMGIVINRPTDMTYETLFDKVNIKLEDTSIAQNSVLFGGPVQPERGFVLHEPFGDWDSSIIINDKTALTTSKDILEAVAMGAGPKKLLFSLGYAGWTPNQLEQEIVQNSWLSVQAKDEATLNKILFETPHAEQLNATMSLLGFDPAMLSDVAGHA